MDKISLNTMSQKWKTLLSWIDEPHDLCCDNRKSDISLASKKRSLSYAGIYVIFLTEEMSEEYLTTWIFIYIWEVHWLLQILSIDESKEPLLVNETIEG